MKVTGIILIFAGLALAVLLVLEADKVNRNNLSSAFAAQPGYWIEESYEKDGVSSWQASIGMIMVYIGIGLCLLSISSGIRLLLVYDKSRRNTKDKIKQVSSPRSMWPFDEVSGFSRIFRDLL